MALGKNYEVRAHKGVERRVANLPKDVKEKLFELVDLLEANPRPRRKGFSQLGKNHYRCWLGLHHRVEWIVDDENAVVVITDVGPRERM